MKLRTDIAAVKASFEINHDSHVMSLGSCFSDNIGSKLNLSGIKISANTNGTLFNPISIFKSLASYVGNDSFKKEDFILENGIYHSRQHSKVKSENLEEIISKCNVWNDVQNTFLKKTDTLFVTLGSAWAYNYNNEVIANCYKLPQSLFEKRLLSVEEITSNFNEVYSKIVAVNPKVKIVFTVSPVRHWKDGAHENNVSKGILHQSCFQLEQEHNNVSYFPAYEFVLDDLRDYRFFNSDLLHPNELAIDYVWAKFQETYFSDRTQLIAKKVYSINKMKAHKVEDEIAKADLNKKIGEKVLALKNEFNLEF